MMMGRREKRERRMEEGRNKERKGGMERQKEGRKEGPFETDWVSLTQEDNRHILNKSNKKMLHHTDNVYFVSRSFFKASRAGFRGAPSSNPITTFCMKVKVPSSFFG